MQADPPAAAPPFPALQEQSSGQPGPAGAGLASPVVTPFAGRLAMALSATGPEVPPAVAIAPPASATARTTPNPLLPIQARPAELPVPPAPPASAGTSQPAASPSAAAEPTPAAVVDPQAPAPPVAGLLAGFAMPLVLLATPCTDPRGSSGKPANDTAGDAARPAGPARHAAGVADTVALAQPVTEVPPATPVAIPPPDRATAGSQSATGQSCIGASGVEGTATAKPGLPAPSPTAPRLADQPQQVPIELNAPAAAPVQPAETAPPDLASRVLPAVVDLTQGAAPAASPPASFEPIQAASTQAASPAAQIAPALVSLAHAPDGAQRLTLRLDPPELGQVQIRIDQPRDAPARVEITVEKPQTLTLLLRDQPQLQRALDQAGVPPDGRSVTFHISVAEPAARSDSAPGLNSGANLAGHAGNGSGGASRQGGSPQQPAANAADDTDAEFIPIALPTWLRVGLDITA